MLICYLSLFVGIQVSDAYVFSVYVLEKCLW